MAGMHGYSFEATLGDIANMVSSASTRLEATANHNGFWPVRQPSITNQAES